MVIVLIVRRVVASRSQDRGARVASRVAASERGAPTMFRI